MLGTVKPRQRTDAPDHARELEEIVLRDYKGVPVRLGDLWRDRPAVLVFLRHYGCHFCRDHAVRLYRDREKFDAAGVRLAVIGQGEPAQAADFRHSQSVDLPLLVDRERISYEAAGAKLGTVGELIGPRILAKMLKRTVASRLPSGGIAVNQGRIVNHPAQLGGVLIIAPDGSIRYAHMSEDSSDIPPNEEVLAAARAIRPHVDTGRVEELGLEPARPAAPFEG